MEKISGAYILHSNTSTYKLKVSLKYFLMKMQGYIYPDVFCVPYYITNSYKKIGMGNSFNSKKYEIIFTELYAHKEQLKYISDLSDQVGNKLIVILGPPYVFLDKINSKSADLIQNIFKNSRLILAYSNYVKEYFNQYTLNQEIKVLNWPFDCQTINKIMRQSSGKKKNTIDILINTPLKFTEYNEFSPFLIKDLLIKAIKSLDEKVSKKIILHSFTYSTADKQEFVRSNFDQDFPIKLQKKTSFKKFILLLNQFDIVINFTSKGILGRITFLSAALKKPGIFSDNNELNLKLYPHSCISNNDHSKIIMAIKELLENIATDNISNQFLPDSKAVSHLGDFSRNSIEFRKLLFN